MTSAHPLSTATVSRSRHSVFGNDVTMFIALLATSLALGGALAHALELPNKITMSREDYFVVQQVYRGWNQLGFLLAVQLTALVAVAVRFWHSPRVLYPALLAIAGLVAAQLVFWFWTFPANVATANWAMMPPTWESLRAQWEYSHLAGAACQLVAMCALIIAALARRRMIDG